MYFPIEGWFRAFALTLAVELPIVAVLLRAAMHDPIRALALATFANLATHPIAWFVATQVLTVGTGLYVVTVESWAIAAESVFYRVAVPGLPWPRAVLVAAAANVASFAVGRAVLATWPEFLAAGGA